MTQNRLNVDYKVQKNPDIKIVLDSNIFLSYLWLTKEEFETFIRVIKSHKNNIIFTQQTIDELYRNLPNHFENNKDNNLGKQVNIKPIQYKFLCPDEKEIVKKAIVLTKENEKLHTSVYYQNNSSLKAFLKNELTQFTVIPRTDEIVDKALKRKYIGNPPMSDKKTVGDEIIWESLINWIKSDIVIVTKDNGFIKNKEFLANEFNRTTNFKLIDICDELDLTTALQNINGSENDNSMRKLKEIENQEKKMLSEQTYESIDFLSPLYNSDVLNKFRKTLKNNLQKCTTPVLRELADALKKVQTDYIQQQIEMIQTITKPISDSSKLLLNPIKSTKNENQKDEG